MHLCNCRRVFWTRGRAVSAVGSATVGNLPSLLSVGSGPNYQVTPQSYHTVIGVYDPGWDDSTVFILYTTYGEYPSAIGGDWHYYGLYLEDLDFQQIVNRELHLNE